MLQWGRDVSIPEIFHTALEARLDGLASMGPGCFYPGNELPARRRHCLHAASMGPGCFYPGNEIIRSIATREIKLQWGRDVSIPEMGVGQVAIGIRYTASMGPGCFYPGNKSRLAQPRRNPLASMGPGCFYPGNRLGPGGHVPGGSLQWGRDVSIPEI